MEYTSNYQLPLWGKEDAIKRTDFNENNEKIDAAVAAVKTEASNALNTAVANGVKIETGTYVGSGEYGKSTPNTLTFSFAPKVVGIVVDAAEQRRGGTIFVAGQSQSSGIGITSSSSSALDLILTWSGNSVSWYATDTDTALDQLNDSSYTYRYFAIG